MELSQGIHHVTGRLYVQVKGGGSSWMWRGRIAGKRADRGLGSCKKVSQAEAEQAAAELDQRHGARHAGQPATRTTPDTAPAVLYDPTAPTVAEIAATIHQQLIAANRITTKKGQDSWMDELKRYGLPELGHYPITKLTTRDVVEALAPIKHTIPATASRIQGRLSQICAYAQAMGYVNGNAADSKAVNIALPTMRRQQQHFESMPHTEAPAAYARLTSNPLSTPTVVAATQLMALTLLRGHEVRLLEWSDIDWDTHTLTVPAHRMKMRREHRIPISSQTARILRELEAARDDTNPLIVPNAKTGKPLSHMAIGRHMQITGTDNATAHGWRSTGRMWIAEHLPETPMEVAEMCLAHQVTRAYLRTDFLEQRRPVMQAWADYLTSY